MSRTKVSHDFQTLIKNTEVMKHVLESLEEEPARILIHICKEYEASGRPVPDHHFHVSGYIGEVALRALVAAGLIQSRPGRRFSLYDYEPTPAGLEHYRKLVSSDGK